MEKREVICVNGYMKVPYNRPPGRPIPQNRFKIGVGGLFHIAPGNIWTSSQAYRLHLHILKTAYRLLISCFMLFWSTQVVRLLRIVQQNWIKLPGFVLTKGRIVQFTVTRFNTEKTLFFGCFEGFMKYPMSNFSFLLFQH